MNDDNSYILDYSIYFFQDVCNITTYLVECGITSETQMQLYPCFVDRIAVFILFRCVADEFEISKRVKWRNGSTDVRPYSTIYSCFTRYLNPRLIFRKAWNDLVNTITPIDKSKMTDLPSLASPPCNEVASWTWNDTLNSTEAPRQYYMFK